MRDLNNIKDKWKVYYEEEINSSVDSLWDLISSPSNLELFHPFCKSNKIIKWPGENSIDELIYLNGLTFIRKFKQGYGRLIRSKKDYGSLICADSRILTKNYGDFDSNIKPSF